MYLWPVSITYTKTENRIMLLSIVKTAHALAAICYRAISDARELGDWVAKMLRHKIIQLRRSYNLPRAISYVHRPEGICALGKPF